MYVKFMVVGDPEIIKMGVVKIDVSSICIKFENFMQAGCRDQGLHHERTVYCRKPIILPKLVLIFGTYLEFPVVLPSIICDHNLNCNSHDCKLLISLPFNIISARFLWFQPAVWWLAWVAGNNNCSFLLLLWQSDLLWGVIIITLWSDITHPSWSRRKPRTGLRSENFLEKRDYVFWHQQVCLINLNGFWCSRNITKLPKEQRTEEIWGDNC